MITDIVTFFAPSRPPAEGLIVAGGRELLVFPNGQELKPDGGAGELSQKKEILATLGSGKGGLVVSRSDSGLEIKIVEKSGFRPPRRALLLAPGSPMVMKSIAEISGRQLAEGEHVVLPVDEESEQRLKQFHEFLEYLPSDRAMLILHTLRRPSIDRRLADLESRLRAAPARAQSPEGKSSEGKSPRGKSPGGQPHDFASWLPTSRSDWIFLGSVVVIVGAVLALGYVLDPFGFYDTPPETFVADPATESSPATRETNRGRQSDVQRSGIIGQDIPSKGFDEARDELFEAMRSAAPQTRVRLLHGEIAKQMEPTEPATVVQALMRVSALRENERQGSAARWDGATRRMLAYAACPGGKPIAVPDVTGLPHLDVTSKECAAVSEAQAIETLDGLTKWVQTQTASARRAPR